ncbi:probable DNA-directed RNA polymerase III subunit RPC6 isoform X2 [Drosophila ananassae]|uniref:probable DNA-directed RNA polymerase III subunit RPC6 isoform X2 n=1 Tax=Drosophila ananassae TaxID=7217 RepID=UPI001CFFB661|nr:probable DNA-directed RNA polymerase III subunit RPC6 isoform X2 [Drosophila ananassae]
MAAEVSQLLLAVIQGIANGATNDDLTKALPDIEPATRVEALNILLQQGGIEILKKGEKLVYRARDPEKKSALPKDADNEEKVVYGIVEEGGNKGIWIRDIRMKSNLNMIQLNKILKNLETKKLIKAVKSVNVRLARRRYTCCTIWSPICRSLEARGIRIRTLRWSLSMFSTSNAYGFCK